MNKYFVDVERKQQQQAKQFGINPYKKIDINLLDNERYKAPREVFDYYHSSSDDPKEKMTRKEIEDIISDVSLDIRSNSGKAGVLTKKGKKHSLTKKKEK